MTRWASPSAFALSIGLAAALAGCGKSEPVALPLAAAKPATGKSPSSAGTEQSASAEEVARQARADVACPAKIVSPPRAENAAVDDVVGVRPGLTYEEAMNAVLCSNPLLVAVPATGRGFNLKAPTAATLRQGFVARIAEPRVVKSSKQILQDMQRDTIARGSNAVREDLKPGQMKWYAATMGLQGQERVVSVAREERFAADQTPTIDSLTSALLKKYGRPTQDQKASSGRLPLLRWAYDPFGRLITETSPLYGRCMGSSDPDAGVTLSPDCGIVVQAMLFPQRANPGLVDRMQVGVVDQAGGYRAITSTEQALSQIDLQRRTQEVEKASKNSKAPTL